MKKVFFVIAMIALPMMLHAQSPLDKVFDKYSGREGFTTVSINQSMFELFSSMSDNDKEDKDFKEITSRLTAIKILSCEGKGGKKDGEELYHEVNRCIAAPEYQELMTVNDGGENVRFMIRKRGDKISELVMAVSGKEACVIWLAGDIDLKQISKLSKSMNISGFDKLGDVAKKGK